MQWVEDLTVSYAGKKKIAKKEMKIIITAKNHRLSMV